MKILLIMPHPNPKRGLFTRVNYPSLTLKQLAAITPPEHEIDLVDERCEPINFDKKYDIVANCHWCNKKITISVNNKKAHYRMTGRAYCSKKCGLKYRSKISSELIRKSHKEIRD